MVSVLKFFALHSFNFAEDENSFLISFREDGIPCMSYRFIESLVNDEELSSMEIALRLSTEQSGFSQLLRQDLKEGGNC